MTTMTSEQPILQIVIVANPISRTQLLSYENDTVGHALSLAQQGILVEHRFWQSCAAIDTPRSSQVQKLNWPSSTQPH